MSNALTGNERISILGNTTQTSVSLKELQGESGGVTAEELDQRLATFRSDLSGFDVGLGDVDNTSDADKPISTATQAALDKKVNLADLLGTQLPQDAVEGSTLKYIGGAWVAVPPEATQ